MAADEAYSASHSAHEDPDASPDVSRQLEDWRDDFNGHTSLELQKVYKFSLEYDHLWNDTFQRYDALVASQKKLRVLPLPWQDSLAKFRENEVTERRMYRGPLGDNLRKLRPLAVHMHHYKGAGDRDLGERRSYNWRSTLADWVEFQELAGASDDSFLKTLSHSQQSSFQVLSEWWAATYSSPDLVRSFERFIRSQARTIYPQPQLALKSCDAETMTDVSLYHSSCCSLFISEFNPARWEPYLCPEYIRNLQDIRYESCRHAVTQKMAFSTLHPSQNVPLPPYTRFVRNEDFWLQHETCGEGPFYLWDNIHRRTIRTSDLGSLPAYTCISHTWGRWRSPGFSQVMGVPWTVPNNTLYDVNKLPEMLSKLSAPWIWIDLFCIPQDRSKRADLEIARQATIFRGSATCLAWLHDVLSWTGVNAAIDWICLKYLSMTNREDLVTPEALSLAWEAADVELELVESPYSFVSLVPARWFSSLWTLQEAILCPDIKLCARDWSILKDRDGCPIALDSLAALGSLVTSYILATHRPETHMSNQDAYMNRLSDQNDGENLSSARLPQASANLAGFILRTQLNTVLSGRSPAQVLAVASMRTCTRSREPAIMSAIGVTDWYSAMLQCGSDMTNLKTRVLGQYHIEFVREAFAKFGAQFLDGDFAETRRLSLRSLLHRRVVGSMLPFTEKTGYVIDRLTSSGSHRLEVINHPSLQTWTINNDGSINVAEAGILCSNRQSHEDSIEATVYAKGSKKRRDKLVVNDISSYVKTLSERDMVYAVVLSTEDSVQYGVFLQSPRVKLGSRRYLLKIGTFNTFWRVKTPPSKEVNWIIL